MGTKRLKDFLIKGFTINQKSKNKLKQTIQHT